MSSERSASPGNTVGEQRANCCAIAAQPLAAPANSGTRLRSASDSDKLSRFSGGDPTRLPPGTPGSQRPASYGTRELQREDIEILEDLSPILHRPGHVHRPGQPQPRAGRGHRQRRRRRPGRIREAMSSVILYEDGSAAVEDDGRGIPVDIHPKKKVPAVQVIFTTLHSGGKFRKTDKDAAYRIAGGLHGVGVCVQQCAVQAPRSRRQARRRRLPHRVRRQRQGEGAAEEDRHRGPARHRHARALLARSEVFRLAEDRRGRSRGAAAREGDAAAGREVHARHREERQDRDADLALSRRASRAISTAPSRAQEPVAEQLLRRALHRRAVRVATASPKARARCGRSPGRRRAIWSPSRTST